MPRRLSDHQILKAIRERVREGRTAKGWTQERLAEAVDVEPGTIWKYETGRLQIAVPMIRRIARALSVEYAWLLGVDPPALRKGEERLLQLWRSIGEDEKRALVLLLRGICRT